MILSSCHDYSLNKDYHCCCHCHYMQRIYVYNFSPCLVLSCLVLSCLALSVCVREEDVHEKRVKKEKWKRKEKRKSKEKIKKQERSEKRNLFIQINRQTDRRTEGRTDKHKSFIDMRYYTEQYSKSNSIEESRIKSNRIDWK